MTVSAHRVPQSAELWVAEEARVRENNSKASERYNALLVAEPLSRAARGK